MNNKPILLEVGVKAFIKNSEGKYLVLKRAKPYPGEMVKKWDIPGGRIKPEEKTIDALAREIKEETGLAIAHIETILAAQDIMRVSTRHTVRITYLITCKEHTNIKLRAKEHSEYRWVTVPELQTMDHDPFLDEVLTKLQ
jgi:8-oxo-dGTP diphosphatase